MPVSNDELIERVTYHPPTQMAVAVHGRVREYIMQGLKFCNTEIPQGRESALAMTKLEEAMFWMNAAIARNHDQL